MVPRIVLPRSGSVRFRDDFSEPRTGPRVRFSSFHEPEPEPERTRTQVRFRFSTGPNLNWTWRSQTRCHQDDESNDRRYVDITRTTCSLLTHIPQVSFAAPETPQSHALSRLLLRIRESRWTHLLRMCTQCRGNCGRVLSSPLSSHCSTP